MLEVAIMIEGQDGLNWPRWQRIVRTVEAAGFVGLYRSDHFTNARPPDKDSLELWVSLTWLASHSRRLEFGPLVSPVSFRHPTMTARMAAAVDDLSDGRFHLGLGAGWQEREHTNFGRDLLEVPERFYRFEEGLEVVTRLLHGSEPVTYSGHYYRLRDAILLPRPQRPGGPPIVVGGNGPRRTLPLAARFADEWNGVFITPAKIEALNHRLDELLVANSRRPDEVRRSLMTGVVFGRSEAELADRVAPYGPLHTVDSLRATGRIVGTGPQIVEQLKAFEAAGVQRIMLQWLDLDDMDRLAALAEAVLPHFS